MDSYRQRQISQSDCEISSSCVKNKVSRERASCLTCVSCVLKVGPCNFLFVCSAHTHAGYPGLSFLPQGFSPYRRREER